MNKKRKQPPVVDMTDEDFLGTLTGYDELAVKKRFDEAILDLMGSPTYLRALVFVNRCRENGGVGKAEVESEAKKHCMSLTLRQCSDYFADGDDDSDSDADGAEGDGLTVEDRRRMAARAAGYEVDDAEGEALAAESGGQQPEQQPAAPLTSVRTSA